MRARVLFSAALAVLMGWLYGGDALLLLGLRQEPWVALASEPSAPLTGLGLAVLLAGAGALLLGLLTHRPASWRPFLLLPVAGTVVVLLDLGLLAPGRPGIPVEGQARDALSTVAGAIASSAVEGRLLVDPRRLQEDLRRLGPPPFFRDGARLEGWLLTLRRGCSGPLTQVGDSRPGTVLVCLAPSEDHAWITVVTLQGRSGAPTVPSSGDWVELVRAPLASPPEAPPPAPMWETGTPGALDGG